MQTFNYGDLYKQQTLHQWTVLQQVKISFSTLNISEITAQASSLLLCMTLLLSNRKHIAKINKQFCLGQVH